MQEVQLQAHSSPHEAWSKILSVVRDQVSEQTYRTWFAPIRPQALAESKLSVEVPNPFYIDWLEEHHSDLLTQAACSALNDDIAIRFLVSGDYADEALPSSPASPLDLQTQPPPQARRNSSRQGLNPRFTFENFVVGKSCEFCHAACKAVAKNPGHVYNPLFIYGGVGLGKTHIMQAIGNHVCHTQPNASVRYVSSEKFMNEMIQSIQKGTTFEFKQTYRSTDLLLIDDIQFLMGKESTQEEFFHTFNTLYDAHKQIIITCDRPPRELRELEERLVSRFSWGLVTDVLPPDFETRVAILRRKAESEQFQISDDVLHRIADRISNNIRELEGSLIRLSALASLTGSAITPDLADDVLKDLIRERKARRVEIADIQKAVSKHYDISLELLKGKRRTNRIAFPRQVGMYLSKQLTPASLVEIGKQFGGRDHSTVLYACDKIETRRETDMELEGDLTHLRGELEVDRNEQRYSH